jgi:lipoate-protein ligase A
MIDLLYGNLVNSFKEVFGIIFMSAPLTVEEKILAHQIKEKKYSCKKWNYRK